ncbi:DUF4214 domain-containing protein [Methylobacter svalbardensis]|uniref:DUF4214 domain-containing protein n=1 Tax=Methylobacter svalbardensis TaxID=3080016 RepID=UPI0030ECBBF0
MGIYTDSVQKLYVAYFNRPADPAGLAYWEGVVANNAGNTAPISAAFSQSPEYVAAFAGMSNVAVVNTIYQNLFGRPAEDEGSAFWAKALDDGRMTVSDAVTHIAAGALTTDLTTFNNKVIAATAFTVALETAPELVAYNYAAAKTWLSAVTDDASLATQQASLAAIVAAIVAGTADNPGQTFTLTTGGDNLAGTAGNDTFNATYDGGVATDTLGVDDIIDGLGGIDTLKIDHLIDVAITPPDTLWTGLSNIEKVVINTTGDGAQTLTTGVNFEAAFAAGVALTTTTSGAGAITLDMSTFTGEAVLNTTSVAGAQTLVTGSGLTTVTAISDAGALDIKGIGLALVSATTTGAGAQTIGDAGGNGASLTMVNATANSGTQTITSTNTADTAVTAISTSGLQHITTGAGNDTVTTTAAAGTINTISTGAGNDTIVASLGSDLITGGLGADKMTGGGGVDTFVFGANDSIIGVSMDSITDFNVGGTDILTFGATTTVLAVDATDLVAGANVQTTAGGLIGFHADDSTLALKIAAVQADTELDVAGSVGMFVDGGNTYVYYAGTAAGNADDQLIQLSGITTLATLTGGSTMSIA